MGVIHKLRPEIINLILERKKNNPWLSCRSLTRQFQKEYQIRLSKSSVNALFKEAGLSLSVGRKLSRKKRAASLRSLPTKPQALVAATALQERPLLASLEKLPEPLREKKPLPQPEKFLFLSQLPDNLETTAAVLLKAVDYFFGGSNCLSRLLQAKLGISREQALSLTNFLVYSSLNLSPAQLNTLLGKSFPLEELKIWAEKLAQDKTLPEQLLKELSNILQEADYFELNFAEGRPLYIDGQFYSLWPQAPACLSSPLYQVRNTWTAILTSEEPLVLLSATGPDSAENPALLNLLAGLRTNSIRDIIICAKASAEIESLPQPTGKIKFIHPRPQNRTLQGADKTMGRFSISLQETSGSSPEQGRRISPRSFIFGLWPWQLKAYRKIKSLAEFRPVDLDCGQTWYAAATQVELTCPLSKTTFSLNGAALKKNLSEKTQVIVLGEPGEMMGLVRAYLGHWPEPQESIQAAERRLEFFHYSAGKSHPALAEAWPLELPADTQTFFNRYLETLDIYLRSWLLPPGYEKKSFSLTQERFYRRGVRFEPAKGCLFINLIIPEGYSFCQDLQYSCQRLNEKNLPAPQGGKVVFRLKQAS